MRAMAITSARPREGLVIEVSRAPTRNVVDGVGWVGDLGRPAMSAAYFRALTSRCRKATRDCSDLYAKEDFRSLAQEFDAKADEVDFPTHKTPARNWRGPIRIEQA